MSGLQQKIDESVKYLKKYRVDDIDFAIILGTGLEGFAENIEEEESIAYEAIPFMPIPTTSFHKGKLTIGKFKNKRCIVFHGRFHRYEGMSYFEITYSIRLLKELGVDKLIISNAAGGINLEYNKGEVMLIEDHIYLQDTSPLAEKGIEVFGNKFVDMSEPYDVEFREKAKGIAQELNLPLHSGVYASVIGPQLETKAEYRYLKLIGADAVGMSTVPEIIVANQLGMRCVAFSVLTDMCDPDNLQPINIPEIMEMAKIGEQHLTQLLKEFIKKI